MEWIPSKEEHLEELASWFQDLESCRQWGGPNFRFPFAAETFRADLRWGEMASWSLCEDGRLAAFGQYYERRGRCHLARLAVAPADRGRGLGTLLVEELSRRGLRELGLESASLFVLKDNLTALRLYLKLGFAAQPCSETLPGLPPESFLYLVR